MVDAGNQFLPSLQPVFHAKLIQQRAGAYLHAVAETDGFHAGIALHVAAEHRHGVGVVQEKRVRTYFLHIPGKVLHDRNRAQRPHDAADAQGIADGLPQTVFFRHFKVDDCAWIIEANLNGVNHKVRVPKRFLSVFDTQPAFNFAVVTLGVAHGFQDGFALFQARPVNIVKGKRAIPQRFCTQTIPDNIPGKNGTSGSHKRDFHAIYAPYLFFMQDGRLPSRGCLNDYTILPDIRQLRQRRCPLRCSAGPSGHTCA